MTEWWRREVRTYRGRGRDSGERGEGVMEEERKGDDRDAGWKVKIKIKYEKMKLEGKVDCMFL